MRRLLLLTAALTLSIAPLAHADVYTLDFRETYDTSGTLGGFDLTINTGDLLSRTSPYYHYCLEYGEPCFIAVGPTTTGIFSGEPTQSYYLVNNYGQIITFEDDVPGGPFYAYNFSVQIHPNLPTTPPTFFTGAVTAPVLPTGDLAYSVFTYDGDASGIVTITDTSSTSPVPEPSTLTLLGTGILGLAGALRKRLHS